MRARTRRWLAFSIVVLALALNACSPVTSKPREGADAITGGLAKNANGFVDITAQQLAEWLPNKHFTLVNTHIPYDGELPQTDLFIPYNDIGQSLARLPADKAAPLVVYCRSGVMSTEAAKELVKLGYTNVLELDGGFNAWQLAGYEVRYRP